MTSSNIILFSNADQKRHPHNTRSSFTNTLPQPIDFSSEECEVGLSAIYIDLLFSKIPSNLVNLSYPSLMLQQVEDYEDGLEKLIPFSANTFEYVNSVGDLSWLFGRLIGTSRKVQIISQSDKIKIMFSGYVLAMNIKVANWLKIDLNDYERTMVGTSGEEWVWLKSAFSINKKTILNSPYPQNINVVLSEIQPTLTSDGYKQIITSIPQSLYESNKQLSLEFKDVQFYKLQRSVLSSLSIQLTNEKNEPLKLGHGQGTVVSLTVKQKMDSTFWVTVRSTDNKDVYPNNSASNFIVELPRLLHLDPNSWETALSTAEIPTSINLQPYLDSDFAVFQTRDVYELLNKSPIYNDTNFLDELVLAINKCVKSTIIVNIENEEISLTCPIKTHVKFSVSLGFLFGSLGEIFIRFTPNTPFKLGKLNLSKIRPQVMLVKTNFSKHVILGSKYDQIIQIIPIIKKDSSFVYENDNKNFIGVLGEPIRKIHIQLLDLLEKPIQFRSRDVSLFNFIFREKINN